MSQSVLPSDDVLVHVDDVAYVSHAKRTGFPMTLIELRAIRMARQEKYHRPAIEFVESYT